MGPDHYAVLGVRPGATLDEIRAAYRAKARTAHPDAGGSAVQMAEVNLAYSVLSDKASRAAYDSPGSEPQATSLPRSVLFTRRLPWIATLLVLALLFVVSAYAGGPSDDAEIRPQSSSPVGLCLEQQPALDAFVRCPAEGGQVVVAEPQAGEPCPAGSRAHRVRGRRQTVCVRPD